MTRKQLASVPLWKQAAVFACLGYFVLAWILPVFMLPFFNILPYVHAMEEEHRILVSTALSVLTCAALIALQKPSRVLRNFREPGSTRWEKTKNLLFAIGGLALFTYAGAVCSPNFFGTLVRVLPGSTYEANIVLDSVSAKGSRYRSVSLTFTDPEAGGTKYLVLSNRLFQYPKFKPGDVLTLYGKQGPLGVYIEEFRVNNRGVK